MLALLGLPDVTTAGAGHALQVISGSDLDPTLVFGSFLVVLARLAGFFIVAPFWGSMNIPMTVRVAFAVVLSLVLSPLLMDTVAPALATQNVNGIGAGLILLLVNQVLIGAALGLVAAFVFYAIESAGRVIDTQRGSNMSDIIAPQTGERTSPTGQWLNMIALVIMLVTGQHLLLLNGLIDSFHVFPPTTSLSWFTGHVVNGHHSLKSAPAVQQLAELSGNSLLITVQIAAPAMISLMLTDILLGIINRGAPQVNVFSLSQVVKGPIGIASVFVALIPILTFIKSGLIPQLVGDGPVSIHHMAELMAKGVGA